METTQEQLALARSAKKSINTASTALKNQALEAMASQLLKATEAILAANQIDMEAARGKISEVMLDRLFLDQERIAGMAQGIRALIDLPDPIGEVLDTEVLENGLEIQKVRVAMGVIGIIYESRPNVTSDAAALAIKSGNAVVLRTGKDAFHSAQAIVTALKAGLEEAGLNPDLLQLIQDTSRASSLAMMKAKGYLDLLIPRGGAGLIQAVVENAIVPVIETGTGIVHVYVDKEADFQKALAIIENAKTSRPSVCNAMEVLLVDQAIASDFLPLVNRSPQKVEEFIRQYGGTASNLEQVFQDAEFIFLGVKPYQICPLLEEYKDILGQRSNLLLVSMAAGMELDKMARVVKNDRVGLIRIMPNTPVAIGQGVISLARTQAVTDQQVARVKQLLAGAGTLYEIEEKLMDPATAVAGCGPAFVYQMIEAMADAGVGLGLSREQALQMAAQTFKGAASMVIETGQHPGSLKDAVCSPGGSTIAGVNRLEQVGLRGDIIAGVEAAYKRTQEMGQEAGKN